MLSQTSSLDSAILAGLLCQRYSQGAVGKARVLDIWHCICPVARPRSSFNDSKEDQMAHGIIWWIIVGLIAGWAAGKIMKGSGYGMIADIVLGIIGGIVGGWVVGLLGFGGGGLIWSILVAILGAVILIWLTRLIKREV